MFRLTDLWHSGKNGFFRDARKSGKEERPDAYKKYNMNGKRLFNTYRNVYIMCNFLVSKNIGHTALIKLIY